MRTRRTILALGLALVAGLLPAPAEAGTWREDFNTPGGLPASLSRYYGGTFQADSISVHDGLLDLYMFNRQNPSAPGGWESARSAVVPSVGGRYLNFQYGEIQWEMMVQPTSGGLVGWNVVGLLWPESDRPEDGEIDFPEWHMGYDMKAYVHDTGPRHSYNCQIFTITGAPGPLNAWHRYGIRWSAYGFSFWVDGRRYFDTVCGQPRGRMHFVIQIGADPGKTGVAPGNSFGHTLIKWILKT
jgi:hypothetical protein